MTTNILGVIIESVNGRDKNNKFVVLKEENEYIYYADGRTRTVENPKKKKFKHIKIIGESGLNEIKRVTNKQLRNALAEFNKNSAGEEE